ncbi:GcrA family cell cycle regulator (plasmid) [Sinorhizobium meliloti]|nr:GcrA family cell cycle regulator [Sinorhizobium meliloti]WQO98252.1 GcrA family cell cycle regulator [Sinorhizobium meliloti]
MLALARTPGQRRADGLPTKDRDGHRAGRRGASGITIQHRTADIEAASKPWKDDLSASQIARRFGVSPNVIAGIAFRNRALFSSKPRARNCRPHESKRAPRKDKTAMRDRKPDTIIIPPHKYDLERLPFAKRLLELRPGECIWPINDGSPFLFCAAKTAGKYCQHHQSRAVAVHRIAKREK